MASGLALFGFTRSVKMMAVASLSCLAVMTSSVQADTPYPPGPIRLVLGFPPGNATDTVARALAAKLEAKMNRSFVVENRAGAAGTIGTTYAAKAAPDGTTLAIGSNGTMAISPWLYKNLAYDPRTDFTPIALLVHLPMYVVVHPSVPADTLDEFLALARRQPGVLSFGSSGNGSANHLAAAVLADTTGIDLLHVPYKGSGPALIDLIGGRLTLMVDTAPAVMQAIKAGQVKALAVTSPGRATAMPELVTVAERGYPGFDVQVWLGLTAPAGLDPALAQQLSDAVNEIFQDVSFQDSMNTIGAEAVRASSPAHFSEHIQIQLSRWGAVVKKLGLQPQ